MEIGVALIGAGNIARLGHIPGLLRAGAKIVAICDADLNKARTLAAELDQEPRAFTDYREMLAAVRPEAVSIAIPNVFHAAVTIEALQTGAHVLCEKPLATTLSDGKRMVEAAKRADRVLALNLHFRLRPEFQLLKKMIGAGDLGEIFHITTKMMRRSGVPAYGSWFTRREMAGGGAFTDLGAQLVDLVMWLLDFPSVRDVSAQFASQLGPRRIGLGDWGRHEAEGLFDVEDFASVRVQTEDGCVIVFETSWAYFGPDESRVQVLGSLAGVDVNGGSGANQAPLCVYRPFHGSVSQTFPYLPVTSAIQGTTSDREWLLSMQQFVDACHGQPGIATGAEALRCVEILERAYSQCEQSGAELV
jgi:predicted dehydrogenase